VRKGPTDRFCSGLAAGCRSQRLRSGIGPPAPGRHRELLEESSCLLGCSASGLDGAGAWLRRRRRCDRFGRSARALMRRGLDVGSVSVKAALVVGRLMIKTLLVRVGVGLDTTP